MKNQIPSTFTFPEIAVLLIAFLLLSRYVRFAWHKPLEKRTLHRLYGIDPKTFAKWIALFCPDLITPTQYARRRKLPPHLALAILLRLGFPGSNTPVQSKRQIIESADGSYRSLRESIRRFPNRFRINAAIFKTLHVFPPEIARQMRAQYS